MQKVQRKGRLPSVCFHCMWDNREFPKVKKLGFILVKKWFYQLCLFLIIPTYKFIIAWQYNVHCFGPTDPFLTGLKKEIPGAKKIRVCNTVHSMRITAVAEIGLHAGSGF